jgi:hypothetical protein
LLSEVYEEGMFPVKFWLLRSGVCKLTQFPSSTGRFPDSWFPLESKNWRCRRDPKDEGMLPDTWFLCRLRTCSS